jgi:hypothetical protein
LRQAHSRSSVPGGEPIEGSVKMRCRHSEAVHKEHRTVISRRTGCPRMGSSASWRV